MEIRGVESDRRFVGSERHAILLTPREDHGNVLVKVFGRGPDFGGGVEGIEVVSIGGGLGFRMGRDVRNKEVEKDGGDHRALRYTKAYLFRLGEPGIVGDAGCAPAKVGGEPTDYVVVEGGVGNFGKE